MPKKKMVSKSALPARALGIVLVLFGACVGAAESGSTAANTKPTAEQRLLDRPVGNYPMNMRQWGIQGDGLVDFTLTADGRIEAIDAIRSPHPAFEYAMIQILLGSKFAPLKKDDAKSVRVRVPFRFRLTDTGESDLTVKELTDKDLPFAFPKEASTGLPDAMRYDIPPGIRVVAPVVYPRELLSASKRGRAKVIVAINEKGLVNGVKLVETTHPDFGEATKAMMYGMEFTPATKDGKAIATVFNYEQKFNANARDTWVTPTTEKLLSAIEAKAADIVEMDALDKRPAARYQPPPVDARAADAPPENVIIEFFIDPDGGVQLPAIKSAKNVELGWAAATAVKRWIFEQPTANGKPVFVRRELQFEFK